MESGRESPYLELAFLICWPNCFSGRFFGKFPENACWNWDSYNRMSLLSPGGGYRERGKAAVGVLLESRGRNWRTCFVEEGGEAKIRS